MMRKAGLVWLFVAIVSASTLAQRESSAAKINPVTLKYLGTAGWEISDGSTIILIDPHLSRINGPAPPGGGSGHALAGDTRKAYAWSDLATPDEAAIDAHI
jgi:L-ascorbate metabolism protein UlaG (beta-lactamase superfamily)